jgi:hypothetical protein
LLEKPALLLAQRRLDVRSVQAREGIAAEEIMPHIFTALMLGIAKGRPHEPLIIRRRLSGRDIDAERCPARRRGDCIRKDALPISDERRFQRRVRLQHQSVVQQVFVILVRLVDPLHWLGPLRSESNEFVYGTKLKASLSDLWQQ